MGRFFRSCDLVGIGRRKIGSLWKKTGFQHSVRRREIRDWIKAERTEDYISKSSRGEKGRKSKRKTRRKGLVGIVLWG